MLEAKEYNGPELTIESRELPEQGKRRFGRPARGRQTRDEWHQDPYDVLVLAGKLAKLFQCERSAPINAR